MFSIIVLTYNRVKSLQKCLGSIINNTTLPYEIIVVDNGSTDETVQVLSEFQHSKLMDLKCVLLPTNQGVCARNEGFRLARYSLIQQIDDDVTVHKGWDKAVKEAFESDPKIGMVGVQGSLVNENFDFDTWKHNNGYVDELTGYFVCSRNIGVNYDSKIEFFWSEDSDRSFTYKSLGWKLKVIPMVCTHVSLRTEIDWNLHNKNKDYVKNKWKGRLKELRLGGN